MSTAVIVVLALVVVALAVGLANARARFNDLAGETERQRATGRLTTATLENDRAALRAIIAQTTNAAHGVPLYPGADFLGKYEPGPNQEMYLYGTSGAFARDQRLGGSAQN